MADSGISRRRLLVAGAILSGGAAAAGDAVPPEAAPTTIAGEVPWQPGSADAPPEAVGRGYAYFNPAEAAFIEAATARLIPKDEHGGGALEAGVPTFIDRQLDGPYGHGDHFYMQGPWGEPLKTQGYQSRYTPAQMYRAAIRAIGGYVASNFSGHAFHDLSGDDQDRVLKALESGEAKLDGVDAKGFFTLLLQNTKEGFFSDPIYGGNRDLIAWRMIGFPGARYDYREWVGKHGQRYPLPPVGLKGRPDWSERG